MMSGKKEVHVYPWSSGVKGWGCCVAWQTILNMFKANEMMEAIISFLGCSHLLDYDYPQGWQVSLSVLQNLIFGDKTVHPDVQADVTKC